jgi:hypothetical protein
MPPQREVLHILSNSQGRPQLSTVSIFYSGLLTWWYLVGCSQSVEMKQGKNVDMHFRAQAPSAVNVKITLNYDRSSSTTTALPRGPG